MTSPASAVFLASVLLLLSNRIRSRTVESLEPVTQTTSAETDENDFPDIRQQLIEDFKSKVLRGLNMSQPPTENLTDEFLSNKKIELLQEEEKEICRSEPKKNVIVHHSNDDFSCQRGNRTFCTKFEFNITSDLESISSVHAYFHKTQLNERLTLTVHDPDSIDDEPLITLREDSEKNKIDPEWIFFELPKKLALEAEDDHLICSVQIEGSDVSIKGEESPFLVITKHVGAIERNRRDVEDDSSNENCTCCEDNYHITLDDIGWSNWIYAPTSFDMRICRGQCNENISSFRFNYASVIYSFFKINTTFPRPTCNFWGPRCKASKFSSLTMLYKTVNGTIEESNIADMVIEKCACLPKVHTTRNWNANFTSFHNDSKQ